MCGIAGQVRFDGRPVERDRLIRMSEAIAHRGSDADGMWIDGAVGLAHRRLSIVDLSPTGAQPMTSADGRVHILFNGEIYNYQELRAELQVHGVAFRSTSDTEVLLHLYQRGGLAMLKRLRGMFAFALWDAERERLFFARDRVGKKPFFYRQDHQSFSFASEIKALTCVEKPIIDQQALRLFLGLQYVPSPLTGFEGIISLPPGHFGVIERGALRIERYYHVEREPKLDVSFEEAASTVRQQLEEAVRLRLIADVSVGAFLSGGMDSSSIVALMHRASSHEIQTFTMGFPSFGHDERAEARALANKFGTRHHEFEMQATDIASLVDTMVETYDAPYADSSCLPVWLLARETAKHIKVVLVGDGGDELFGGYRRYQAWLKAIEWSRALRGQTHGLSFATRTVGRVRGDVRFDRFGRTLDGLRSSFADGYAALFTGSYFSLQEERVLLQSEFLQATDRSSALSFVARSFDEHLGAEGALQFDFTSYLPDDLNVKMDRATMAHGLEARAPFLDQELVGYASHLPLSYLLKRGTTKPLLQAAMTGLVPPEVWSRPKRGFQVPLSGWFRQELRPLFQERCLLSNAKLSTICRPAVVQTYLRENDRGKDHGNRLWMLLMLATWMEIYG